MNGEDERLSSGRRNSSREIQEMEQIQRGLTAFLEQELQGMQNSGKQNLNKQAFSKPRPYDRYDPDEEEEFYDDLGTDTDEEEWEEEDFPEDDPGEREIDLTASSDRNSKRRARREDYTEDWDRPRRNTGPRGNGRAAGARGASAQSGTGRGASAQSGTGRGASAQSGTRRGAPAQSGTGRGSAAQNDARRDTAARGSGTGRHAARTPKKKKRFKKLKRFVAALAVIAILLGTGFYLLAGSVYSKMTFDSIDSLAGEPLREDGVVNILLIGNDSRENGTDGRSDAMILLSVSNKTKKIYMTSLLRDMYVEIPGHDGNRLNAAYSYGGPELLMETVEKNLDISVNRYVSVNFEAFANLVDAVGGVDLELTSEEIEYVNGYLVEYNMLTNRPQGTDNMDTSASGLVHLNGPQALAYSRNRYLGTDFGRTERQRKVLSAVIQNLPSAALTNTKELIDGLMPNLTTNLTRGEFYRLGLMAGKLLSYDIEQSNIPLSGTYKDATIRGMAVLEVDFEANKQYLRENIYGQTE